MLYRLCMQHPEKKISPQLRFIASVLDLIGGGSRSTTPASVGSRKSQQSPTNEQGVQVSGNRKDDKKIVRPIQPPNQRNFHRDRRDSKGDYQDRQFQNQRPNRNQAYHPNNQNYNNQNYQGHQRGGWIQRGQIRRGRPRGGPGFKPPQNGQPIQQGGAPGNRTKNTLKFDNDYDFEQANTQFEELRSQLGKVKLDEVKPEVNGESEKKEDSGNETGAGEGEQEEENEVFYDKSKSFFDNISCEAVERSKGRSQRTDWRQERKLNSETFGVAATRRGG